MPAEYDEDLHTYVLEGKPVQMTPMDWINLWVPYEWRHVVCMCVATEQDHDKSHMTRRCLKCGKAERWQLSKGCKGCGETYCIRFLHHMKNSGGAHGLTCYACLVAKYGEQEGDVPPEVKARALQTLSEIMADTDMDDDFNFEF